MSSTDPASCPDAAPHPAALEARAAATIAESARHSIRTNAVFGVVGTALYSGCQFGVVVLLAKFATPDILGQFVDSNAMTAPIVLFLTLELRSALVADATGQFTFGAYRMLSNVAMTIATLILIVMAAVQAWLGAEGTLLAIFVGVFLGKIAWSLAEPNRGVFQKRERLDIMCWSNALRGGVMIAPFMLLLPLAYFRLTGRWSAGATLSDAGTRTLAALTAAAVLVYAVGWLAVWWWYDRPRTLAGRDLDFAWSWPAVRRLALHALPLGICILIINLCDSIPRLIIGHVGGRPDAKADLGYFGALAYVTMAGSLIMIQVGAAASRRLAVYYQSDLRAFIRLSIKLTALAVGMGLGIFLLCWLCGQWILRVLYTPEYARYYEEFLILVAAQCIVLLANIFGFVVTFMGFFWVQVPIQVVILVLTTWTAWVLIPDDPVRGGAWTTVVRNSTQAGLCMISAVGGILWKQRALRQAARAGSR